MRTSTQAQRTGRSQKTSPGVKSKAGSNTTRHSMNPPPSRPSFAVTDSQHIPTRRHAPLRASKPGRLNGGKQPQAATPSEGSEGVQRRQERPAPLAQTRQKPQPEPVQAQQERSQVRREPRVEKHARVPRVAPAPPRVAPARQEPMRREVVSAESMTDEVDPLDTEYAEIERQLGSLLALVGELSDDTTSLNEEDLEQVLQQLESLQMGVQSVQREMSRRRRLFGPALMQMEELQLEMELEILRREAEPQTEPPKKVEMKEHVVSRTECSEGNECAICLCEFRYHEKGVISLKCGHVFHKDCVAKWFEAHHTCPICRTDIDDG